MNNLEKQLKKLPKAKLSIKADVKIKWRLYKLLWQQKFRTPASSFYVSRYRLVAIVVLLLIIITPAYAYASPSVTRGHFLYPIKQSVEKVELSLAISPEAKIKTELKLAERRLDEAVVLSDQGKVENNEHVLAETINESMNLKKQAEEKISEVKQDKVEEVAQTIEKTEEKSLNNLTYIAKTAGLKADDKTLDTIAIAIETVKTNKEEKEKTPKENKEFAPAFEEATTSTEIIEEEEATSTQEEEKETPSADTILKTRQQFRTNNEEQAQTSLRKIKEEIEVLQEEITEDKYEKEDVDNLFNRFNNKVQQAQGKIESGDLNGVDSILEATKALTNNAKYFIKPKQNSSDNNKKNKENKKSQENNNENSNQEDVDRSMDSADSPQANSSQFHFFQQNLEQAGQAEQAPSINEIGSVGIKDKNKDGNEGEEIMNNESDNGYKMPPGQAKKKNNKNSK